MSEMRGTKIRARGRALTRAAGQGLLVALALAGAGTLAAGLWIPAKAALAEVLLERSWEQARERRVKGAGDARDALPTRPWPWADFAPVARLEAPRLGVSRVVVSDAGGASLAFASGWVPGTAPPGSAGNTALAGHRDTTFAFLEDLAPGDLLTLETPSGERRSYRVTWARVAHEADGRALEPTGEAALTLVTCYPFDALDPGGELRWVVRAVAG